ncbi:unnamed protein product [Musa hybrid cultivar]
MESNSMESHVKLLLRDLILSDFFCGRTDTSTPEEIKEQLHSLTWESASGGRRACGSSSRNWHRQRNQLGSWNWMGSQGFSGPAGRTEPGWVISESDCAPNPGLRDPNSGRENRCSDLLFFSASQPRIRRRRLPEILSRKTSENHRQFIETPICIS